MPNPPISAETVCPVLTSRECPKKEDKNAEMLFGPVAIFTFLNIILS
jgi:hypothetical protein